MRRPATDAAKRPDLLYFARRIGSPSIHKFAITATTIWQFAVRSRPASNSLTNVAAGVGVRLRKRLRSNDGEANGPSENLNAPCVAAMIKASS